MKQMPILQSLRNNFKFIEIGKPLIGQIVSS